jgi:hypothetical protein
LAGSGTDGIAIFRPLSGYWYFDTNKDALLMIPSHFGKSEDGPVFAIGNLIFLFTLFSDFRGAFLSGYVSFLQIYSQLILTL